MLYLGIDPGVNGGIAFIDRDAAFAVKMPATLRGVLDALATYAGDLGANAVVERVHSSPQMGVVSAFTFGRGVGALHMALTALRIPFDEVTPQTWQRALGCLTGGDKNLSKAHAQRLFPTLTVTHAIADALLIAEFARRHHQPGRIDHAEKTLTRIEAEIEDASRRAVARAGAHAPPQARAARRAGRGHSESRR